MKEGSDHEQRAKETVADESNHHRVVFLRHGESTWNRDDRYIGWTGETESEMTQTIRGLLTVGLVKDRIPKWEFASEASAAACTCSAHLTALSLRFFLEIRIHELLCIQQSFHVSVG